MKNLTYMKIIFFGIRFGKQTFFFKSHDVFNKFWPKMNNLWKKRKKIYKKCEKLNQSLQISSNNRKKIMKKIKMNFFYRISDFFFVKMVFCKYLENGKS